jgi:hypothetical protein
LKISITAQGGARLFLTDGDMRRLGFTLEAFEKDEIQTRLFISCITAFLAELGLVRLQGTEIVCDVTPCCGGAVVEITSKQQSSEEESEVMMMFDSPQELTAFCRRLSQEQLSALRENELYRIARSYCLILSFGCSSQQLSSQQIFSEGIFDSIHIQKVKEYARLLSHTPVDTIRSIISP